MIGDSMWLWTLIFNYSNVTAVVKTVSRFPDDDDDDVNGRKRVGRVASVPTTSLARGEKILRLPFYSSFILKAAVPLEATLKHEKAVFSKTGAETFVRNAISSSRQND